MSLGMAGESGHPQLTSISWSPSSQRTEWVYVRLGYDITQYNFFLDQTEGMTDAETLRQRAEIRFLRALHYWYFLDLFGKAPFKEHFSNDLPVEKKGTELYTYIQNELNEIEADMYEPRQAPSDVQTKPPTGCSAHVCT